MELAQEPATEAELNALAWLERAGCHVRAGVPVEWFTLDGRAGGYVWATGVAEITVQRCSARFDRSADPALVWELYRLVKPSSWIRQRGESLAAVPEVASGYASRYPDSFRVGQLASLQRLALIKQLEYEQAQLSWSRAQAACVPWEYEDEGVRRLALSLQENHRGTASELRRLIAQVLCDAEPSVAALEIQ